MARDSRGRKHSRNTAPRSPNTVSKPASKQARSFSSQLEEMVVYPKMEVSEVVDQKIAELRCQKTSCRSTVGECGVILEPAVPKNRLTGNRLAHDHNTTESRNLHTKLLRTRNHNITESRNFKTHSLCTRNVNLIRTRMTMAALKQMCIRANARISTSTASARTHAQIPCVLAHTWTCKPPQTHMQYQDADQSSTQTCTPKKNTRARMRALKFPRK